MTYFWTAYIHTSYRTIIGQAFDITSDINLSHASTSLSFLTSLHLPVSLSVCRIAITGVPQLPTWFQNISLLHSFSSCVYAEVRTYE